MKKYTLICIGLCAAMAFTSCKSSESAYKKAYEKAKQYDTNTQEAAQETASNEVVVAPVEAKPVDQTRVVDNLDNVSVRQETVQVIHGNGLNAFSVVVGSFSLLSNAENLYQNLRNSGYDAQVVKNEEKNMYRVVASSFSDKPSAVTSRDKLRNTYPDAWLLYNAR